MPEDDVIISANFEVLPSILISATPRAFVTRLTGSYDLLTIIVTVKYADGSTILHEELFTIVSNSAGTYQVNRYFVYVDVKSNTQIKACYIVSAL